MSEMKERIKQFIEGAKETQYYHDPKGCYLYNHLFKGGFTFQDGDIPMRFFDKNIVDNTHLFDDEDYRVFLDNKDNILMIHKYLNFSVGALKSSPMINIECRDGPFLVYDFGEQDGNKLTLCVPMFET